MILKNNVPIHFLSTSLCGIGGGGKNHPHGQDFSFTQTTFVLTKDLNPSKEGQRKAAGAPYRALLRNMLANVSATLCQGRVFVCLKLGDMLQEQLYLSYEIGFNRYLSLKRSHESCGNLQRSDRKANGTKHV